MQSNIPHSFGNVYDESGGLTDKDRHLKGAGTEAVNSIDRMFKAIEKKLRMREFGGIVEESLKSSVFGQFSKNYKLFQNQIGNEHKKEQFLNFFSNSEILTDEHYLYKALLYFNLPYETIIRNMIEPKKIFEFRYEDSDEKNKNFGNLIEKFENAKNAKGSESQMAMPSIVLIKTDLGTDEDGQERSYIFGGYASHGWLVSGNIRHTSGNGDSTCFLFNLTKNLRFNAREGM